MRWFLSLFRPSVKDELIDSLKTDRTILQQSNSRLLIEINRLSAANTNLQVKMDETIKLHNTMLKQQATKKRPLLPDWMKDVDLEAMGFPEKEQ